MKTMLQVPTPYQSLMQPLQSLLSGVEKQFASLSAEPGGDYAAVERC